MNNKKVKMLLYLFLLVICSFLLPRSSAFAGTKETVLEKSVLQGLYRCYTTGAINNDAGTLSTFHKFETLIIGDGSNNGEYIALPASLTDINDNNISCKGLFMGDSVGLFTESGSFDGLFKMFGKSEYAENITSDTEKTTLLKGMGYSSTSTSNTKNCVYYVYANDDPSGNGESYTDKVCFSGGELSVETNNRDCGNSSGICIAPVGFQANGKTLTIRDSLWTKEKKVTYSSGWEKFRSDLNAVMSSEFYRPEGGDAFTYTFSSEKSDNTQSTDGDSVYTFSDSKSAATAAIKFLNPSYTSYSSLALTDKEKLWYYENTVTNWFYKNKSLDDYYKCGISENPSLNSQYIIINVNPSTGAKNTANDCGVNKENTTNSNGIHGFNRNNHFNADGSVGKMDLAAVVTAINDLVGSMSDDELSAIADEIAADNSGNGEVEKNCNNSAGSLGWILCPILQALADASNEAWESYIQPALKVNTVLLGNTTTTPSGEEVQSDAAEKAWGIFRNISNVIFIIFFLVVIFSQLTGVGIDNYGIKKILPKLIIAAILVNLSFLICQLAVDLSNILGAGLYNMMNDMGENIAVGSSLTVNDSSGSMGATVLTGVAILVAIAGFVGAFWQNGIAVLIPLLIGALSVAISIAFLFILLSVRQAGVVVLVVVSPIAFVCYLLPNIREKIFNKWLKAFEGLLLLYPVCGLLVGGGNFVSKLLLSTGGGNTSFFLALTAMVAGIAPIFFIPTLLKGAFAAIGNIGNTISNLGNRVGKGVSSGVGNRLKNSETLRRADNALGRHSLSKRRRAKSVADTAALTRERAERDRLGDRKNIKTRLASITASEEAKATDEATAQRLSLMMSSGKQGGIVMEDGTRAAYTLDNAEKRVIELRDTAAKRSLSGEEKLELSALSRGMSNMAGGAGKLGKAIRGASVSDPATGQSKANSNFMSAMGEIYSRDSAVQSKLNEKDAGASAFTENFMPGGQRYKGDFAAYKSEHKDDIKERIKTYSAGLNQGSAAVDDYISSLGDNDIQSIVNNKELYNSLDIDVRKKIDNRGISSEPQQVKIVGDAPVLDSVPNPEIAQPGKTDSVPNPEIAQPGESFNLRPGTTTTDSGIILGGTNADYKRIAADFRRSVDQHRQQGGKA